MSFEDYDLAAAVVEALREKERHDGTQFISLWPVKHGGGWGGTCGRGELDGCIMHRVHTKIFLKNKIETK